MVLGAGCEKDQQQAGSLLLPLSAELKPALDASRQSLAGSDQGIEKYKQDLDRYFGIEQMLRDPQLRASAADSLFILWEANPTHFLWPDLAAWNWHLLDRGLEPGATFFHPALSDSTNAAGAYARAFRTIGYSSRGEDFHTAWELRDTLDPFQRIWLQLKLAWLERRGGRDKEAIRLAMSALPEVRRLGGRRLELIFWTDITHGLIQGDHLDDAMHAVTMAEELALSVADENGMIYRAQSLRQLRADVLAARQETEAALALYEDCAEAALEAGIPYLATLNLNRAGILTSRTGDYELGLRLNQRSLEVSLADRDSLSVPKLLMNIARRHRLLGRLDSCLVYQQQAERWVAGYPDLTLRARMPLMQAEYYAQIGDYGTVDSLLSAAAALTPNRSNMEALAELHLRMIEENMERGRPDLSYRSIAVLDSLRDRLGSSLADRNAVVDLDLHSADFLGRQGQYKLSAEAMDRAESALDTGDDPARRWRLAKLRGELARRRGDHLAAESAFRQCIALSEERQNKDLLATKLSSVVIEKGRVPSPLDVAPPLVAQLVDSDIS